MALPDWMTRRTRVHAEPMLPQTQAILAPQEETSWVPDWITRRSPMLPRAVSLPDWMTRVTPEEDKPKDDDKPKTPKERRGKLIKAFALKQTLEREREAEAAAAAAAMPVGEPTPSAALAAGAPPQMQGTLAEPPPGAAPTPPSPGPGAALMPPPPAPPMPPPGMPQGAPPPPQATPVAPPPPQAPVGPPAATAGPPLPPAPPFPTGPAVAGAPLPPAVDVGAPPPAVAEAAPPPPPPPSVAEEAAPVAEALAAEDAAAEATAATPTQVEKPAPKPQTLAERRKELRDKYLDILNRADEPVDYRDLQEQMAERQKTSGIHLQSALLAGLGPKAIRGAREPLLKQALAAREPLKVEGGQIGPGGEVMLDPGFKIKEERERAMRGLENIDKMEATQIEAELRRAEIAATNRATEAYRTANLGLRERELQRKIAKDAAGDGMGKPIPVNSVDVASGQRIYRDQLSGVEFTTDPVSGVRTPATGAQMVPDLHQKQTIAAGALLASGKRLDELKARMQKDPKAFGGLATFASLTPNMVKGWLLDLKLTPKQKQLRQEVLNEAAEVLHKIYGATQTLGEADRASDWAPTNKDSPEMIVSKLNSAIAWKNAKLGAIDPDVQKYARNRLQLDKPSLDELYDQSGK